MSSPGVKDFYCPVCKAVPGTLCRNLAGQLVMTPHRARKRKLEDVLRRQRGEL
jgi:hypothetical protein